MSEFNLPYLATPGNIPKAFERIKNVPTPPRVTQDFVKTKLQIPGGSGDAMSSFLRKIGLVNPDGTPSELYIKARNPVTASWALSQAFQQGYAPLYEHHEYVHELSEEELKGLIIQVTGCATDSRTLSLTLRSIERLKELADFDAKKPNVSAAQQKESTQAEITGLPQIQHPPVPSAHPKKLGMSLSYTINLNLPPSTDIAVFNAIFKSLKENLLKDVDE